METCDEKSGSEGLAIGVPGEDRMTKAVIQKI